MNIPFLTVMGLAAASTVLIAVLIAVTLLPALLGFAGGRVALLGRSAWKLPRRVERVMPDVDIEGEHLLERLSPSPSRP